jgi:cell division protein ZapA
MKQVEVTIMGQSYLLACPEGGQLALLEAVERVDREMSSIRDAGKIKARDRIAVLSALNLAYALAEAPPSSSVRGNPRRAEPEGAATADSALDARIDHLISRIDQTLGADGQLL